MRFRDFLSREAARMHDFHGPKLCDHAGGLCGLADAHIRCERDEYARIHPTSVHNRSHAPECDLPTGSTCTRIGQGTIDHVAMARATKLARCSSCDANARGMINEGRRVPISSMRKALGEGAAGELTTASTLAIWPCWPLG